MKPPLNPDYISKQGISRLLSLSVQWYATYDVYLFVIVKLHF